MYRLISYNLHSGIGRDGIQDYHRIGRFLAAQNADFVLLQEMDTRPQERGVNDDISAICANGHFELIPGKTMTTAYGWYGNAILSRHPVLHRQQFDISVENREPRTLQQVVVSANDHQISLLNAHLGLKKRERAYQARCLYDAVSDIQQRFNIPACVGGDMNEWWPNTKIFKRLDKQYRQLDTGRTFPSQLPLIKLDRLWASKRIIVSEVGRLRGAAFDHFSDHLPVQMDFDIALPEQ
ncbi:endonuclease/exonuclease/phosphatase family protein [Alteromonas gilva]|uniref:Endonuclease/exonuclease/phosphatase family protein n=1 Tax=Alteromonas gilva TaxID=2987522 RepID=A0ABT5L1P4_9ALTE|nr:endonuclease/exonuclease/phosphatase family protein [Alteromonas gilva]MDC8830955.1 endonuclease/exonuclease/phosphatase family protein [Alteromonas gilva]